MFVCVWVPCGGLCGTVLDQLITLFIVSLGRSISRVLTPLESGPFVSIGNTTGGRGFDNICYLVWLYPSIGQLIYVVILN